MKKRVVLYNPEGETYTMPLGLMAVGSYLPASRYQVEIYDGRVDREAFLTTIAQAGDDLFAVGLSVLTGKPIEDAVATSRYVKEQRPHVPIVWGGVASFHPAGAVRKLAVRGLCRGRSRGDQLSRAPGATGT